MMSWSLKLEAAINLKCNDIAFRFIHWPYSINGNMPGSIFYTVKGVVRIDINTVLHICTLGDCYYKRITSCECAFFWVKNSLGLWGHLLVRDLQPDRLVLKLLIWLTLFNIWRSLCCSQRHHGLSEPIQPIPGLNIHTTSSDTSYLAYGDNLVASFSTQARSSPYILSFTPWLRLYVCQL